MDNLPITNGVRTMLPAPDGYLVDFEHPLQRKALENYLIFGIGGTLATMALFQRYYTKVYLSGGLGFDDGLPPFPFECNANVQVTGLG